MVRQRRRRGRRKYSQRTLQRKRQLHRRVVLFFVVLLSLAGILVGKKVISRLRENREVQQVRDENLQFVGAPDFKVDLLDPNEYSRPGIALEKVKGIVVHYTANPGSTAKNNRDYFNGLQNSHETKVSSHFVIGIDGEIVQCVPSTEVAYASNERNSDTLSIECCHKDETGTFTKETYHSLVELVGWLCHRFDLKPDDVIRHYDVTGKMCPKYYVDHPDEWEKFKKDVKKQIKKVDKEVKKASQENG